MRLKTELLPHQVKAVEKLSKLKVGALYMEMGTGKTRTALELIVKRLNQGKVNKVLWLCPFSVKPEIEREINKHVEGDLSVFVIEGIESLSLSIRLNSKLLELVQSNDVYLIIDESNLVKNHRAKRTQNIQRLAEHCKYKLILNGTPISKNEKDLFSQWRILDWRILGYMSFWSFANNHLEYDDYGRIRRTLNVDYLCRKIAPYTYQVKKSECLELPEKTYSSKGFWLTDKQREEYELVKDMFLSDVDEFDSTTVYRLFTALQHVLSGKEIISNLREPIKAVNMFKNPEDNPRIELLLTLLEKIEDKVIIWCKYTDEIITISQLLKKIYGDSSTVEFYGELSKKERRSAVEKFNKDARFFIANKSCAGYGLNLQVCSYAIYYTNDWDWATRSQSEDRIHRIGQKKNVHIIDIYARNTLDERILDCLWRKEKLVDSFKKEIEKTKTITDLRKWIDGTKIGI